MATVDRETRQLINAARTLGSGALSVYLEDDELLRLCAVIAADLEIEHAIGASAPQPALTDDYYTMPLT